MNITEIVTYTVPPQSRRREELSVCNVFFAVLVILIHIIAEPADGFSKDSLPYFLALGVWRLSSFVVQGYFFLSGVRLFLSGKKESAGRFYLGRLRRVVLPYLAACCLFSLYALLTGTMELTPAAFLISLFTGRLCGHFYYVILIVQFYLLTPLWQKVIRKTDPMLGCLTALLVMSICKIYMPSLLEFLTGSPFTENNLLFTSYLFYFIAGTYCGMAYDRLRIFVDRYRISLLVTWGILGIINWIFLWMQYRGIYYAPWLELFHVLYCIYAILGSLSLGYLWREKKLFQAKFFRLADKWSYHVYLLHPLVIFMGDSMFNKLGLQSLTLRFGLRVVMVYGIMAVVVLLLGKLPQKHKPERT